MIAALSFWGLSGTWAYVLVVAAVIGAITAILAAIWKVVSFFRRVARSADAWLGDPGSGKGGVLHTQHLLLKEVRELRESQTAQQSALNQLVAEIPVNGVPLRSVIEAIRDDQELIKAGMKLTDLNVATVRRKQTRIERLVRETEARWIAKLQAQGIDTPEKRLS